MSITICIIMGFIALVIGFVFGKFGGKKIDPRELTEKINFAIGTENESLKKENETIKKKNLFFGTKEFSCFSFS